MQKDIPEGYKQDAKVRLIPLEMVKPIDQLSDDLINTIFQRGYCPA